MCAEHEELMLRENICRRQRPSYLNVSREEASPVNASPLRWLNGKQEELLTRSRRSERPRRKG